MLRPAAGLTATGVGPPISSVLTIGLNASFAPALAPPTDTRSASHPGRTASPRTHE